VPLGAGLSSSAALECAVALAVDDLFGLGLGGSADGRRELAAACISAENDVVGASTGGMDQAAALLATEGHALLIDTRDGSTRQVPFAPGEVGLGVLVIDTMVRHKLVFSEYNNRRAAIEKAAEILGRPDLRDATLADIAGLDPDLLPRARHIVTEIARVRTTAELLDEGRLPEIGPLLDASHESCAHDYDVSCPELDLACSAARKAGALGARMVGGGFGGSAIALVPLDGIDEITTAVRVAFANAGFKDPEIRTAAPSAGAQRLP
jgi:galactokinase